MGNPRGGSNPPFGTIFAFPSLSNHHKIPASLAIICHTFSIDTEILPDDNFYIVWDCGFESDLLDEGLLITLRLPLRMSFLRKQETISSQNHWTPAFAGVTNLELLEVPISFKR